MFFRVVSSVVFAGGTIFSTIFFWESVFLDDLKLFFYSTEKFDQDVYVLSASFFFLSLALSLENCPSVIGVLPLELVKGFYQAWQIVGDDTGVYTTSFQISATNEYHAAFRAISTSH